MKEMHERAVKAAARYAEIKGYEVLDREWTSGTLAGRIDLVAKDDDAYVFIEVTAVDRSEGGFAEGRLTREQLEAVISEQFLRVDGPLAVAAPEPTEEYRAAGDVLYGDVGLAAAAAAPLRREHSSSPRSGSAGLRSCLESE